MCLCACVSACVSSLIVARQRLGKQVPAATNTHNPCRLKHSVSSLRKIDDYFFPELLVMFVVTCKYEEKLTRIGVSAQGANKIKIRLGMNVITDCSWTCPSGDQKRLCCIVKKGDDLQFQCVLLGWTLRMLYHAIVCLLLLWSWSVWQCNTVRLYAELNNMLCGLYLCIIPRPAQRTIMYN
jgi:hypothetical protein